MAPTVRALRGADLLHHVCLHCYLARSYLARCYLHGGRGLRDDLPQ